MNLFIDYVSIGWPIPGYNVTDPFANFLFWLIPLVFVVVCFYIAIFILGTKYKETKEQNIQTKME